MRESILFLPAAIRSHVIPFMYLANMLRDRYEIFFAVSNSVLQEFVEKQGFQAIRTNNYLTGYNMEARFVRERKQKSNKWSILRSVLNNDIYQFRKKELSVIVDKLVPKAILIDIFSSSDLIALYALNHKQKMCFLNPMLSTYHTDGYPSISDNEWPSEYAVKNNIPAQNSIARFVENPFQFVYAACLKWQLDHLIKKSGLHSTHPIVTERNTALLFKNIPEIVFAPIELEFSPTLKRESQIYFGLCITESRSDTELDATFQDRFQKALENKNLGKKLIYCSFGTFYQGSDQTLLNFLHRLLNAIDALGNTVLILSVNQWVIQTLQSQIEISETVYLFSRVPQLQVLKNADLFITHGGLGSVKESIHHEVPMLVYPLDLHYDQNGNGFKVEYHGLGLQGVFKSESACTMAKKLKRILSENTFKTNLALIKKNIEKNYSGEKLQMQLEHLL